MGFAGCMAVNWELGEVARCLVSVVEEFGGAGNGCGGLEASWKASGVLMGVL